MAENLTDPVKNPEVPEVVENEVVQSEPNYTDNEKRAMELGWKPKEKWVEDGNEESDHRSAKDFLERGEMIGKLRSAERELQNQKVALQRLADRNQKIYETGYQNAIQDLKAQRREALQEGDLVKAEDIADQIKDTEQKLEKTKMDNALPTSPATDPDFEPWLQVNPWYTDKTMQKFADALAADYVAENRQRGVQVTMGQTRDFVAQVVRKEFAHRFEKKPVQGAPNPDAAGRGRTSGEKGNDSSQLAKVKSGLTDDERQIMKTIIRATGMSESEYLKQYASAPVVRR